MERKSEFFEAAPWRQLFSVSKVPPVLYPQEADWTCSVACVRTILSGILGGPQGVPGEAEIVARFGLKPGPHFSAEIRDLGLLEPGGAGRTGGAQDAGAGRAGGPQGAGAGEPGGRPEAGSAGGLCPGISDVIYGADENLGGLKTIPDMCDYMRAGYYVMLESMINYSHWMVMLGYFSLGGSGDSEDGRILFYDTYYDRVRLEIADEFAGMWEDPEADVNGIRHDFICVKGK